MLKETGYPTNQVILFIHLLIFHLSIYSFKLYINFLSQQLYFLPFISLAPCLSFELTATGGAANLRNKVLGTYLLQDAKTWINNRVVYYSSETGNYLYWMNKPSNKVKGEHGFWMVRILDKYWALTRNKILK